MSILSLAYPYSAENPFDLDYYTTTHLAKVQEAWGDLVEKVDLLQGVAPIDGSAHPAFAVIAIVHFTSPEALTTALTRPESLLLAADLPNYAKVQPTVQINQPVAIG